MRYKRLVLLSNVEVYVNENLYLKAALLVFLILNQLDYEFQV